MDIMDPMTGSFWLRIAVSVLCGMLIGLERQVRGKPAGIRTSILVCLATQVFVQLSLSVGHEPENPARVIGQIVTGVGFLGGGVIMAREGLVTGVTSAAVIWVLAAIGATVGIGELVAAVAITVVTLVILIGVELLERSAQSLRRGVHSVRSEREGEPERYRAGDTRDPL